MLNLKSFTTLREATKLTPAELKKDNSVTKEPRLDILQRLIKSSTPLELAKGGTIVITDIDDALAQIEIFKKLGKPFNLVVGEKLFSSSLLAKSGVFGGGSGSGGGSLNTKITESHQCVVCQAMLDNGIQNEDYFMSEDVLKAAYKVVDVDASFDEIMSVEGDWFHSSYESAVLLIKQGYINKSHVFHRNSKLMNAIYALKNVAYKNSDQKPVKDDKWNPGDIWAIEKGFNIKSLNVDTIMGYNKDLLQAFVDRKLVGISLKLVKKKAKHGEYNVKLPPDTDDHKVMKILFQGEKRGTFWSNKGATIIFDDGKFALKDGSAGGSIKGEIVLKTARGGGAGWSIMQDAAKQVFKKKVPDHKSGIYKHAKAIAKKKDPRSVAVFFKLYNHFYKNETQEQFEKELFKKDVNWISAKLACLYILYFVDKFQGPKANRWITKIINYAGSKSEDSSAYVKIYE